MNMMFSRAFTTGKNLLFLFLGWLEPAIFATFESIRWGILVAGLLGVSYVSVTCLNLFILNPHESPGIRMAQMATISILLELGIVGVILRRLWNRRSQSATLESDPKNGALFLATPEGDCYPAVVSANGDYRIQLGDQGRFATVTETLDGYHLQTDEGKEFLLNRLTWAGDYLPLVLVGAFALWIDVAYCIQAAGNLALQKFPVEGFQIAGLLTFLFGCGFFRAARLIIRRKQCPSPTILTVTGIITGAVLGWFGTQEGAGTIITAILVAGVYVGVGEVLRRRQQGAFDR
jgi:hypothetical protein